MLEAMDQFFHGHGLSALLTFDNDPALSAVPVATISSPHWRTFCYVLESNPTSSHPIVQTATRA